MTELMTFSIPQMAEAIRAMGYRGKPVVGDSVAFIESATDGRTFAVYAMAAEEDYRLPEGSQAELVRFFACWPDMEDLGARQADDLCNWFNRAQPFSKLYRRDSEPSFDLVLEADLYVLDGMSEKAFQGRVAAFIRSYEIAMKSLERCSFVDKAAILEQHNQAIELLHGDAPDPARAVDLYRSNAYRGFAGSQNNFGDLFEDGKFVAKDDLVAVYWYTRASERGEPTAYYSLATLLAQRHDNPDALALAVQYAILACEHLPEGKNRTGALEIRNALQEALSPELYRFAEAHAGAFRPIDRERWTLGDAPGPSVTVAPGSDALN